MLSTAMGDSFLMSFVDNRGIRSENGGVYQTRNGATATQVVNSSLMIIMM